MPREWPEGEMDPRILPWIDFVEGRDKYTDDPNDPGGPTLEGITAAGLVGMRGEYLHLFDIDKDGDADANDIKAMAKLGGAERREKIQDFYELLWKRTVGSLQWPWSLMLFDATVHHGPQPAIKLLHDSLGIKVTPETASRVVGPRTLEAIQRIESNDGQDGIEAAVERYCWNRADLMRQICVRRIQSRGYLLGWLNRVAALETAALEVV